jgi:hypothetical protein
MVQGVKVPSEMKIGANLVSTESKPEAILPLNIDLHDMHI